MTTNPMRPALLAVLAVAAFAVAGCSQNNEVAAADPGHASGEHDSGSSAGLPEGRVAIGEQRNAAHRVRRMRSHGRRRRGARHRFHAGFVG